MEELKKIKLKEDLDTLSISYYQEIVKLQEFYIYIFGVYNTNNIRGVVCDEDRLEKMKKLKSDMKVFYNSNDLEPEAIIVGKYYAIFDDEWHRVRCISYDFENKTATVLFIDRGDEDIFPIEDLQVLDPIFMKLPAQSIKVSLNGLEIFENLKEIKKFMCDKLVDKQVYVSDIIKIEIEQNDVPTMFVNLILDVDDDSEEEIDVNELILQEIFKSIIDSKSIIGPESGIGKVLQEVNISHINETAVFIQIKSKGLEYLEILMNELVTKQLNSKNYKHKPISEFDLTKIYVMKNYRDNKWYRVKVKKVENAIEAQAIFIDVGSTAIIKKRQLHSLETLSDLLVRYPEQALKVNLHKISSLMFDENVKNYLQQLASYPSFVTKVIGHNQGIPVVQFYTRAENNELVQVNDELVLICSKNNKSRIKENELKNITIAEDDSYFDVYVTMASSCHNLTIQPLSSLQELEKMMEKLTDCCESFSGPHVKQGNVIVGDVYAALNIDDDRWYRAIVDKVITDRLFVIYLCDYGDFKLIDLDDLLPLKKEFHNLPIQAIKAKLIDIEPEIIENWNVTKSLELNELIVEKKFVGFIQSQEVDETVYNKVVLQLKLIDTSTPNDIYIDEIINKRR